jgi:cyclase
LKDFSIISQISELYGSQSVLVSIDVKKNILGKYKLYSASHRQLMSKPLLEFIKNAVTAGAGEIVLNAVDRDGMMQGMDNKLIREVGTSISVPLIAVGGAGCLSDFKDAIDSGASAVGAGAFFVFQGSHRAVLITYPKYQELLKIFNSK